MTTESELEQCLQLDKKLMLRDKRLRLASTRRNCRLVVSNLAASVTAEQLAGVFRAYGALYEEHTHVGLSLETGEIAGCASAGVDGK